MEMMEAIKEYVAWGPYREALKLPERVTEQYEPLGQGEYNRNFQFVHPVTGKRLVLRVNCGSQMHLENQIQYEYDTLKLLEGSGRTPRPFYVDGSMKKMDHGILVMEFLPGCELDYRSELSRAASCLADIHSVRVGEHTHLLRPEDPLKAILEECESMVKVYLDSDLGQEQMKKRLRSMLDLGWDRWKECDGKSGYECCINTELNSTNFLSDESAGSCYLVDWEKPLYGEPAQDLGHFLAPTTTFWKTDVILEQKEMEEFLDSYFQAVDGRFEMEGIRERTYAYIPITCLRGVTWCAMAWVEYQNPRLLYNPSTYKKLGEYLNEKFLDKIEELLRK